MVASGHATCNDRIMRQPDTDGSDSILAAFWGLGFVAFLLILVFLGVCGVIAWLVAPDDRKWTFFWLTVLLFGPLGILAASVASPRDPSNLAAAVADHVELARIRPRAKGRTRYWCSRCGAQSDLLEFKNSECWRCGEKKFIAANS
jgi:DNA-directed RNA polymerase subunit RPC12/RpoP